MTQALLLIALLLSAFFSGSETAFISARRFKLEAWARQGRRGAASVLRLLSRPEKYLTTTLVGNNVAVVTASTLLAIALRPYFSGAAIIAISSAFLLIVGEILPKSLARERATDVALGAYWILEAAHIVFFPLIWGVTHVSRWILQLVGMESGSVERFFSRKDLELLLRESADSGLMRAEESLWVERWLKRGRQKAYEVMIPRTEIEAVDCEASMETLARRFEVTGNSRLPVYEGDIDHIVGVAFAKDLLLNPTEDIRSLCRAPLFVPETLSVSRLLSQMQEAQVTIALVVDEYGGTAGLLTMEDLFEEYFGEFGEESKNEALWVRKATPRQIDVHARVEIESLNERFALSLPEGDYLTLGGLILDRLGHIPARGERVDLESCRLVVLSSVGKKIHWVRILLKVKPDFSLEKTQNF